MTSDAQMLGSADDDFLDQGRRVPRTPGTPDASVSELRHRDRSGPDDRLQRWDFVAAVLARSLR